MSMSPGEGPSGQDYPPPNSSYGAPPTNAYPSGSGYGGPASTGGFNLQDLWRRWNIVLRNPSVATFDTQHEGANWATILISLVALGFLQGVFGLITNLEFHNVYGYNYSPFRNFGDIIGTPIGFLIGAGILYLIARAFGGRGTFLTHAWLLSLAYVPLSAISAIAGIIPFLGGLIGLAAAIYMVFLAVYATASAHRLPVNTAIWVVLIPTLVAIALFFLLIVAAAALIVGLGLTVPGLP